MRRTIGTALAGLMVMSTVLTGCGASEEQANTAEQSQEGTSITLLNSKSEVAEQINELAAAYQSATGVTVNVINTTAGASVQATIKGMYLSDKMPDIIACESAAFGSWEGLLVDMSDQGWASRTDAAYVDSTYGTIGFPYTTEAIGLAYNADILAKAGVDPASLTTPAAYQEAFAKIDENKEALGLTAVVGWCTEPENLGWSAGNHVFGAYVDSGLARDDTKYIDLLNDGGKFDDTRLSHYAEFIGMLNQYSDPALLVSGTYDNQVKNFAAGKYAFVTQGSWIGATLIGADSAEYEKAGSFKVGMAPYAFEDGMDTILTSPPAWWAVTKEGNSEAAMAFLQWCSEDQGQQILVEKAGFVSPFSDSKYVAQDPFAETISSYIASGKTSNWHWMSMKDGMGQNSLCYVYNEFAKGETDAAGFASALKKAASDYYKK